MSEYETIKQGLILDRDGDPWYYGEEGVECLEQSSMGEATWLYPFTLPDHSFSKLRALVTFGPKELKLPIEYMK